MYNLPVAVDSKLEPGYLEFASKFNANADSNKPQFRLRLKVCSTVYPEDPKLGTFLYSSLREQAPEKEIMAVILDKLLRFLYY
jgi:hypothetical protein